MATSLRRTTPKYATRPIIEELAVAPPFAWHAPTVVFAALCVMVGVYWDISWHMSIGRDSFWTPAHLMIQAGGLIAGLSSGYVALETTFAGTEAEKNAAVGFWGFRAPLGAWICVWGCGAMLTSAPFDNWWHNAYGLDVKIISPPHAILALGFVGIELGALLMVLALQNRAAGEAGATGTGTGRAFQLLYAYAAGIILLNGVTMGMEYVGFPNHAHNALYYKIAAVGGPLYLAAFGRASRLRWPATAAAAGYMGVTLLMIWVLQLFPATPKLAPVFNAVTHMTPPPFPLLLVVPAATLDLLMRRFGAERDWHLSVFVGVAFLAVFLATQWFFADFLLSPYARNYFFGADQWDYSSQLGPWRYRYWRLQTDPITPAALAIAALFAIAAARVGLWWGNWMALVKR